MAKLFHIIKKGLSYKQCLEDIRLVLNDVRRDHFKIKIDKVFSEIDLTMRISLKISYKEKGGK